jgi:hypothetical protein
MKVVSEAVQGLERNPDPGIETGWPMPLSAFLKGNFLERGDIVLTQHKGDLISRSISWFLRNPFSHSAMVFIVPHREPAYDDTYLIEADTGGVDITKLSEYADDLHEAVAIRRINRPWFTPELGERARCRMLHHIKAGYNYWGVWHYLRKVWFGLRRTLALGNQERILARYKRHGFRAPNNFICSGFVQLGIVEAVVEAIKAGKIAPACLKEVVFNPEAQAGLLLPDDWEQFTKAEVDDILDTYLDAVDTELEATMPRDMAKSDALEWRWVIRESYVFPVSNYAEVKAALKGHAPFLVPGQRGGLLGLRKAA